jgi:hypothetical protein
MMSDGALIVSIILWLVIVAAILPMPHFGKDRDEDT